MSKIISFEGYDNVGKTTFINFFKNYLLNKYKNKNIYTIKYPSESIFGKTALQLIDFLYINRNKAVLPHNTKDYVTQSIIDLLYHDKKYIFEKYIEHFQDPNSIILQDRSIMSEYVYHFDYITKYNINTKKNNSFYPNSDITFVFHNNNSLLKDDNGYPFIKRYLNLFKYNNISKYNKEKIDVGLSYILSSYIPLDIEKNPDKEDIILHNNMDRLSIITKLLKKHNIL